MRRLATALALLAITLGPGAAHAMGEDPPAGSFRPTGSLAEARILHEATLLSDGRVLVVGGSTIEMGRLFESDGSDRLASAEVWDPATGTFEATGALSAPRILHTITRLPDGRVLVVGGHDGDATLASAEIWDPKTGAFEATGAMASPRELHSATLMPDGRVLVLGGGMSTPTSVQAWDTAEIWDPETRAFAPAGSIVDARVSHTATLLADGRVFIIGGVAEASFPESVEIWDPESATSSAVGTLDRPRNLHEAVPLSDGRVLVVGGDLTGFGTSGPVIVPGAPPRTLAEVWDLTTMTSAPVGPDTRPSGFHRTFHTATPLGDGRVLVVWGLVNEPWRDDYSRAGDAEVWDPSTEAFGAASVRGGARLAHTATALEDGRVLLVGGEGIAGDEGEEYYDVLASAEVWEPVDG